MLTKELIKRIRKLDITTRKVVSDMLAGQYHSVFKGRGMAFSEVRQYQMGDEIRLIDWNGTALAAALNYLTQIAKRKSVAFLISDFLAANDEKAVRIAGRKHDLVPVVISDPFEEMFPKLGIIDMGDPETLERVVVDTTDPL